MVAWRSTAEFVSRYFTKGRMAVVEGRLQIRDYTDRDGNKRTAAEVVADNVYFGDSSGTPRAAATAVTAAATPPLRPALPSPPSGLRRPPGWGPIRRAGRRRRRTPVLMYPIKTGP